MPKIRSKIRLSSSLTNGLPLPSLSVNCTILFWWSSTLGAYSPLCCCSATSTPYTSRDRQRDFCMRSSFVELDDLCHTRPFRIPTPRRASSLAQHTVIVEFLLWLRLTWSRSAELVVVVLGPRAPLVAAFLGKTWDERARAGRRCTHCGIIDHRSSSGHPKLKNLGIKSIELYSSWMPVWVQFNGFYTNVLKKLGHCCRRTERDFAMTWFGMLGRRQGHWQVSLN